MCDEPAWKYVKWLMQRYRPMCGHPGCKYEAFAESVVHGDSGHVWFICRDMGHWVGTELDVVWVEREEEASDE
jgi:hypothetical protein